MKKLILASLAILGISQHSKAQWSGPTSGLLSTSNTVRITQTLSVGMPGSPSPSLFQIQSIEPAATINILSATFNSVDFSRPINLLGTNLLGKHSSGSTAYQLTSFGNFTLNTDGMIGNNRGLFINSANRNFFSVTENAITFSDANQDLFKVNNNGFLYTRKVVVTLNNPFPDYVFSNTYYLTPLNELEAFIKKYKHLPNVPSAKEISENNNQIELGEMQVRLLEKVEELTLYILQQQKEIETLKQQLGK